MRYFKMLGIAVVAIAALMAFVGVGAASATVFCKVEPTGGSTGTKGTTCPEGSAFTTGTEIHALLKGTVVLKTPFKNLECQKSAWTATTKQEGSGSEAVSAALGVLTFEECNCETKVVTPGTFEMQWVPDTANATVVSSGAEITLSCSTIFGKVHCIYRTTATKLGTFTGENPATFDLEAANLPRQTTNALCLEKGLLEAKYEITTPKPLYIAAET